MMRRGGKRVFILALCAAAALAAPGRSGMAGPAGGNWRIDPAHTAIAFSIDALGYPKTQGAFRQFEGRISINLDRPEKSSVAFHVKTVSVDVGSSAFSDYLRSEAFLDAARHPSIDFVSTSVSRISDHAVRVSGELTLLGVTKPLSVDVAVERLPSGAGQRFAFQAEADIDRLAFGMNSGFPLVSRDVELRISSEAAEL
jgi:polyisoprenoid-binding protein YceI